MLVFITVGFLVVFISFFASKKRNKIYLAFSFLIISMFLGFRYNFGSDYMAYKEKFDAINLGLYYESLVEPGWVFLNKLMPSFFSLIFTLALVNSAIYYKVIREYVPSSSWGMSVFIYFFNFNFLTLQASAMRQTIAILIFVYSIKFIINRNLLKYIIASLIAVTFHNSAIVIIPVYWLAVLNLKSSKKAWGILFIFYLILLLTPDFFTQYIVEFVSNVQGYGKYQHYLSNNAQNLKLINFLIYSCLFILIYAYDKEQSYPIKVFSRILILGLLTLPFSSISVMLVRFGYYFLPASLVVYPALINKMNKKLSVIFIVILVSVFIKRYYSILQVDIWRETLMQYETIFNHI